MSFKPKFEIGATVTNRDIHDSFACGTMQGIRPSNTTKTIVVVSDHPSSTYDDKWNDDVLHYTGAGRIGDQPIDSGRNRTLRDSNTNGMEIHLFEVFEKTRYFYHGPAKLVGAPYQEDQEDVNGNLRKVWMFPIKPISKLPISEDSFSATETLQRKKAKKLTSAQLKARALEASKKAASRKKAATRTVTTEQYERDPFISAYVKNCARGICQLCGNPAPFKDEEGKPFLESHHIIWLKNGGSDTVENSIALCPNCHSKMHVINEAADVKALLEKAKKNL